MHSSTSFQPTQLRRRLFSALQPARFNPEELVACGYFLATAAALSALHVDSLFQVWRVLLLVRLAYGLYELAEVVLSVKYTLQLGTGDSSHDSKPGSDGDIDGAELPVLHIIIVAYLPNEKDIIREHVSHAVTKINYPPARLNVHVAYNTPVDMPETEAALHDLARAHNNLVIHRVPDSSSKADNVNYLLDRLPSSSDGIVAIFDTDHRMNPSSPLHAVRRLMRDPSISALQGRCVPRNVEASLLCGLVAVEFDMLYAITHLGRDRLWDTAMFNGSNGYWRLSALQTLHLDPDMMAEDIELSFRALASRHAIVHDPSILSYELAPTTWRRFWGQRLRWAHGWTQASWKHRRLVVGWPPAGGLRARQRMGLVVLLFLREISTHVQLQYYGAIGVLAWRGMRGDADMDINSVMARFSGKVKLAMLLG
jgi:cellulose synthase/poly-beta-1,6-N-acetylglucosamine synthase-like glycosyltransferase